MCLREKMVWYGEYFFEIGYEILMALQGEPLDYIPRDNWTDAIDALAFRFARARDHIKSSEVFCEKNRCFLSDLRNGESHDVEVMFHSKIMETSQHNGKRIFVHASPGSLSGDAFDPSVSPALRHAQGPLVRF